MHEKTQDLYSHTGRPSVDPEVLIRMMIIGYLYGITSERRLCEEVQLNLAYRWFCGFNLEDKVPDHSTFSKNRHGRFSETGLFRELFLSIVKQAQGHGLVKGQHLTVDATSVQANASLESLEEIVIRFGAEEYLEKMEEENTKEDDDQPALRNQGRKLSNQTHRSKTDPDAQMYRKNFEKLRLTYSENILMDNSSRVIVDVEVTDPNTHEEGQSAARMLQRSRFVLGITPQTLGGDKAYGYGSVVRSICEAGTTPHVAHPQQKGPHLEGIFNKDEFLYDEENDKLICPAGKRLWRRTVHKRNRQIEYVASKADCKRCGLKAQCTKAPNRVVHRHLDKAYLDYAAEQRPKVGYRVSQRYRKKGEMLFGEAKEFMGLRRARRRGHDNVSEQCLITATVQNIMRIVAVMDGLARWARLEVFIQKTPNRLGFVLPALYAACTVETQPVI